MVPMVLFVALWNFLCTTWLDKGSLLFSLSTLGLILQKLDVLAGSSSGVTSNRTGLNPRGFQALHFSNKGSSKVLKSES